MGTSSPRQGGRPAQRLVGADQFGEVSRVGLELRQSVSLVERDHTFKTSPRGHQITAAAIDRGQKPEHSRFSRLMAELDVMFRGVVQTAFGSDEVAAIEIALPQLTVGDGQSLFIADDSVVIEGTFERHDRLLPLSITGFLQRQVVVQNAEGAIVVQRMQKVQGFEVIGAGFFCATGADVEIAEIDQCVGDGVVIALGSLNSQDFTVTRFGLGKIVEEGTGVTQIAKGIREFPLIAGCSVIGHRRFPGRIGLDQVAAM